MITYYTRYVISEKDANIHLNIRINQSIKITYNSIENEIYDVLKRFHPAHCIFY